MGFFMKEKLRALSFFLGLDVPYFVSGGFWITISLIVTTIGGIILSALFARIWPKEVFGQYSFLVSILGFAGLATLPGMSQAVTQAAAENKDGVYKKAILTAGKWSVVGSIILTLISAYYYFSGNSNLSIAILVSALAFPISAAGSLFNAFLAGKKQFRLVAIYGAVAQAASIAATAFALFRFPSLVFVALFSAWSTAIANGLLTLLAGKYATNKGEDNKLIRLGFHLSFSQIFTIGADYLDRLLIPLFLGFTNNAIYAFAILIPMQIHGFLKMFSTLGQPKVAEAGSKNLKRGLVVKSLQLEMVVAAIVLFYIFAAPTIFKILYPSYQSQAVGLSQIFSLSLLYYPGNILALLFLRERQAKPIHQTNVVYGVATVISLMVLVPTMGLVGAIFAKIIARFLQLLAQFYLFGKLKTENN